MKVPARYHSSVFINCPFDPQFDPLFDAIVFGIYDCGFKPRCARETESSGIARIQFIMGLIAECRLAVHDLSRVELSIPTGGAVTDGLPRFNMPLELGLFMGAKHFGGHHHARKNYIIFDTEQYRYQKLVSDVAGQDIKAHHNDPAQAIRQIRNWLAAEAPTVRIPGGSAIAGRYIAFREALPDLARAVRQEVAELKFVDYCALTESWLAANAW